MNDLALRIRNARAEREITQAELAEATGYTRQAVGAFENGQRIPKADFIREACIALQCSADDLLNVTGEAAVRAQNRALTEKTRLTAAVIQRIENSSELAPTLNALLSINDFWRLIALIGLISRYAGASEGVADHTAQMKYECFQMLELVLQDMEQSRLRHADNAARQQYAQDKRAQITDLRNAVDMLTLDLATYYAGE